MTKTKSSEKVTKESLLAEYERVEGPAWAEYKRVRDPALAEYKRVEGPAWDEYERVEGPALAEYERTKGLAWAEYQRVTGLALAEYERITSPALAEYERIKGPAWDEYKRVQGPALAEYKRKLALPLVSEPVADCSRRGVHMKSYSMVRERPADSDDFVVVPDLGGGQRGTGNMIIHGENSLVLAGIAERLRGAVRCIYIDPPYNNQERYFHYDDARSHEEWIADLKSRLEQLAPLLRGDGSIWISIDDREVHYLKVAADQVFGRENFVTTVIWQQRTTRENRRAFSNNHEYLLVYARDVKQFRDSRNPLPTTAEVLSRYKNPDGDPRGPWQSVSANVQGGHGTASQFYVLVAPNGRRHEPPRGRCWIYTEERMSREVRENRVWFGRDGNGAPRLKRFLTGAAGLTPETLWFASDVGTNDSAKKHLLNLFPDAAVFETPKPENLIARVLQIATNEGDLVLDAYLGSGTTAAVAHKMGRRYVGIESGAHAVTHCATRLRAVVSGEAGGISAAVGWVGGRGFDFYRVGEPVRLKAVPGSGLRGRHGRRSTRR